MPTIPFIDSHHHLWRYSATEYPWIGEGQDVLKNDFLLKELHALAQRHSVSGFVTVQARQSIAETRWLLELADNSEKILGVVGWLPLCDLPALDQFLDETADQPWLKGVRHVIQDEPDDSFILNAKFNEGIRQLADTGLVYDILIYAKHLQPTIQFLDLHPNQLFVLDHIAKPQICREQFDATWRQGIRELAKRENVLCKFSGLATQVQDDFWEDTLIEPYWDVALEAFGSSRFMFGSDWPVCLLKSEYQRWLEAVDRLSSQLSIEEQRNFWYQNATQAYGLEFESLNLKPKA